MAITLHPSLHVHPGQWLASEIVAAHKLNVTETAALLRVSRQALSTLLNGRADLSPEMALRFEKVFGIDAETMLRMQLAWDVREMREHADEIVVERSLVAA
ncbi:HigA family addiction module antitoxin [Sphingomonas endophytica]|uniref:XRE family transcriptional regulator n=1 Tax=Sphingomonas endophytica TaxID=869719 RepID=A0A147I3P9_9SPHN|nr:HigA family addiction module antitoxin [Sphingomonas endophytica]KTT72634.1 XRE family transcriptional regulator [Sphingomonas endophytica]